MGYKPLFLFLFFRLWRLGSGFGITFRIGVIPPIPFQVTHSINLSGMFYLPNGVCVATDLLQSGLKCTVDIVIPLLERLGIGILIS